ncbi:DUF3349 domain-containing protein [Mycolicibacterium sp. CBMA 331]
MRNVVAFLRAGGPASVAPTGHIALLALLPRRITDTEIALVADEFKETRRRPATATDVGTASPLDLHT